MRFMLSLKGNFCTWNVINPITSLHDADSKYANHLVRLKTPSEG